MILASFKVGFPKIRATFCGDILRIIVFWRSILGSTYFGNLPGIPKHSLMETYRDIWRTHIEL